MYFHIDRVRAFMHDLGIERGFERNTIQKNRRKGKFDVPSIRIGNTPYFEEKDLLKWLENQKK